MPKLGHRLPKYRTRSDGRACVVLDGRTVYLGKAGSPESQQAYDRAVQEWLAAGRHRPPHVGTAVADDLTVSEVLLAYLCHCEAHYGPDSSEFEKTRLAVRPARELYGSTPAARFGPRALTAVRDKMAADGLGRVTVNQRVQRLVRAFKHAAAAELLPAAVHEALKAVPALRKGRSPGVKPDRAVRPVPPGHVDAVGPHLSPQLWAVVQLLRYTGARAGEILALRSGDLDTSGDVWVYTPARHKTKHLGKQRRVYIGARGQGVLRPWLRPDPSESLFQPREAMEVFQASRREARVTLLTPSQRSRTRKRSPAKGPGECYDSRALNHAVARACDRAGVPRWHPHQLRHTFATEAESAFGREWSRSALGHGSAATTERYVEDDGRRAAEVARRLG